MKEGVQKGKEERKENLKHLKSPVMVRGGNEDFPRSLELPH